MCLVEYDINENNKLVFVYGSREMEETSLQEFDASALELFRVSRPQFEEQESIEVRWESKFTNGQLTLGGYLWDSDEEILNFLVGRYGEYILLKPVLDGKNIFLWFVGPFVFVVCLVGLLTSFIVLRFFIYL